MEGIVSLEHLLTTKSCLDILEDPGLLALATNRMEPRQPKVFHGYKVRACFLERMNSCY